jgi:alpha-N-acetylglucosamine transferase
MRTLSFSTRKLRIPVIVGVILLLVYFFAKHEGYATHLSFGSRKSFQHDDGSATDAIQCLPSGKGKNMVWSDFAYVWYVTNSNYLCNSLMIFEALRRHGTKADLLMLYPQKWNVPKYILDDDARPTDYEGGLLAQARDQYHAKLNPVQVRTYVNEKDSTWQDSYTKLLAWNQTQYKRVISLDSDATLLNARSSPSRRPEAIA